MSYNSAESFDLVMKNMGTIGNVLELTPKALT